MCYNSGDCEVRTKGNSLFNVNKARLLIEPQRKNSINVVYVELNVIAKLKYRIHSSGKINA